MRKNQSSMASAVTLLTALRMFTSGESLSHSVRDFTFYNILHLISLQAHIEKFIKCKIRLSKIKTCLAVD